MNFIIAPLKSIISCKRSPVFHIKETHILIHPYNTETASEPDPERINSIWGTVDVQSAVFKKDNDQSWQAKFTAENIIFEGCGRSSIYHNINITDYPNIQDIYLSSYASHVDLLSDLLYLPHHIIEQEFYGFRNCYHSKEGDFYYRYKNPDHFGQNGIGIFDFRRKWDFRPNEPKGREMIENLAIFIRQKSSNKFFCLTNLDYLENFEVQMNKLCQTNKNFILKNSSPLKMNSRYCS